MFIANRNGSATVAYIKQCSCFKTTIDVIFPRAIFHNRIGANVKTTSDVCSFYLAIIASLRSGRKREERKAHTIKTRQHRKQRKPTKYAARFPSVRTKREETPAMASFSGLSARLDSSGVTGLYKTQLKCAHNVLVITIGPKIRPCQFDRLQISQTLSHFFVFLSIFGNFLDIK